MRIGILVMALFVAACGGGPTGPVGPVTFADRDINLGEGVSGQFHLINSSPEPITGISFGTDPPVNEDGVSVDGARFTVLSGTVGSLVPDRKISFPFTIGVGAIPPGEYSLELMVLVDGVESDRTTIRFVKS